MKQCCSEQEPGCITRQRQQESSNLFSVVNVLLVYTNAEQRHAAALHIVGNGRSMVPLKLKCFLLSGEQPKPLLADDALP